MFKWLRASGDGLAEVEEAFADMLSDDRHVFDLAMSARVGGADPATIAEALHRTEERTDEAERRIRRLVLVHASVHGATDIPACLMYMSIAKDAERIADLSKNLFGIASTVGPPPPGQVRDDLARLWDTISPMITEATRIFADDDRAAAEAFIDAARRLQEHCTEEIDRLLRDQADVPQAAATVLTYRHVSRIVANLLNIVSAVVMPLDRLDYPDDVPDQ
ncbi:MAG TPA: PhoU domain-containing protein [Egibacteraceae bacterium]|jgi:phosphate uptake regulator|nr:PhoU domain-containing protein [Egibacteraceae bacterium]